MSKSLNDRLDAVARAMSDRPGRREDLEIPIRLDVSNLDELDRRLDDLATRAAILRASITITIARITRATAMIDALLEDE